MFFPVIFRGSSDEWFLVTLLSLLAACRAPEATQEATFLVPCDDDVAPSVRTQRVTPLVWGITQGSSLWVVRPSGKALFLPSAAADGWQPLVPSGQCHRPILDVASGSDLDGAVCVRAVGVDDRKVEGERGAATFCRVGAAARWWRLRPPRQDGLADLGRLPVLRRLDDGQHRIYQVFLSAELSSGRWQRGPGPLGAAFVGGYTDDDGATWSLDERQLYGTVRLHLTSHAQGMEATASNFRSHKGQTWCDEDLRCRKDGGPDGSHTTLLINPRRPNERLIQLGAASEWQDAHSLDHGETYGVVDLPIDVERTAFVDAAEPVGALVGMRTGDDTELLRSDDGARTWQSWGKLPVPGCALELTRAPVLTCATSYKAFRSDDGGRVWTLLPPLRATGD